MEEMFINPNFPVYISYAWKSSNEPNIEEDIDKLCQLMNEENIFFLRDKEIGEKCLIPYRRRLKDAEEEIGKGGAILLVLSNKYLRSFNCLYELFCIFKNGENEQRIFPILLSDYPNLKHQEILNSFALYYKKLFEQLAEKKYLYGETLDDAEEAFLYNHGYLDDENKPIILSKLRIFLKNYQRKINGKDYQILIEQIKEHVTKLENNGPKNDLNNKKISSQTSKLNYVPNVANLVARDKVTCALYELFSHEQIINMIGMGGSGKTSIANLFVNDYSHLFNAKVYILINGDFLEDFKTIFENKLNIKCGTLSNIDFFKKVIGILETCPLCNNHYNLFIIDINETANYKQIEKYIDYIREGHLSTWKILLVARIKIRSNITEFDPLLIDNKDINISKNIFFHYLKGKSALYQFNNEEFKSLFEPIFYLPLLIEQIAKFLLRQKRQYAINEILSYIQGGSTSYSNLRTQRINSVILTEKRNIEYDIVQIFLSNLLQFSSLDDTFQTGTLLRNIVKHIMLWPTQYYSVDLIYSLLKGSVQDKTSIEIGLSYLCDQCVVDYSEGLGYKMHGLMAEAFREQVFSSAENNLINDYTSYFNTLAIYDDFYEPTHDNTLSIKESNDNLKECVVSSISNYDLKADNYNIYKDESYFMKIAKVTGDSRVYEKAYKIKWLKQLYPELSNKDLYYALIEYNNKSSHIVYYDWIRKQKNSFSSIEEYTSCHNNIIDQCVKNMVKVSLDNTSNDKLDKKYKKLKTFYINKYQITQEEWNAVMHNNPSDFDISGKYPVERVSWYDCIEFIMKLNEITGLIFFIPNGLQWEFAAIVSYPEKS